MLTRTVHHVTVSLRLRRRHAYLILMLTDLALLFPIYLHYRLPQCTQAKE